MSFAQPEMLWLLAATAPLLTVFLVWSWRKRQQLIARFVQSRLLAQLTVGVSKTRQKARLTLAALAALLLLVALARPQLGFAWEEVHQRGLDLFVAVDTSRSMLAADVSPNRLTRAKLAALDLMQLARTDRLALIAFAGTAFLQCPLTLDDTAFQQGVHLLDVSLLPQGGTAIAQAIEVALAAARSSGDNHKALVLFTDGEDHDGDALLAANRAAEAGLKIFTVGVGTATGDRLRLVDEEGRTSYVLDDAGQPVVSQLNVPLLREIAAKTGGDFLPLAGADPMRLLYEARLGRLPKSDLGARQFRQYHERFQWPLALALLLLVLEVFLPDRRRRVPRPPHPPGAPPRSAAAVLALTLLTGTAFPFSLAASSASALKAYGRGRFDQATQEYERLLEKRPQDPRLLFNAGTAAYQAGDLTTATNRLTAATRSTDPALLQSTYYNLGNAFYRLGQNAPAPPAAAAHWQQAIQHYESALQLDPNDRDAQFNREFVRHQLETLQQQMSQPNQNRDQDRQDQKDQDQKEQDPASRPQEQPSPDPNQTPQPPDQPADGQPQPEPQPPSPDQSPESSPDKPSSSESEPSSGQEESQADRDRPAPQPGSPDQRGQTNQSAGASQPGAPPGQMTPEQARQILEAARLDERPWQLLPPTDPRKTRRPHRDW